ncbi:MAG: GIY-YIG nuclease family protein, partial [candidate division Zixibacteria bacterium]|nr:GIY-YIG nuclease family protein [candidate division Zixibacteria bacterium]
MSAKRKTVHRARQLILGYLESVSREVFSDFPRVLTDLVGREHGVYALYKKGHLYYIGLATNLRTRIKNHLRDKHAGKWDSFSLYLVRKADHIRELESLILRIADPKGNRTRGKLPRASNLRRDLWKGIKIEQETKLIEMFGSGIKPRKVGK